MLIICLLALPSMADPGVSHRIDQDPTIPVATCSRPLIQVTQPSTVSALSPTEVADNLTIARLLRHWEQSVQSNPEWSRSQREEFRRRMKNQFNEHSMAAAEQLVGHVRRDRLYEMYDWRIVDQTRERICLEATPRDETERLFYGGIRVWLDAESGIPAQIAIISRNQVNRLAWQSESIRHNDNVQLVHFENDIPPAPSSLVRTANSRVD